MTADRPTLREALEKYVAWQYRQPGALRFTLADLRAALADAEPVGPWKGGMPLVPAWCIDHAETEVIWNGHHIPAAAAEPPGLDVGRARRCVIQASIYMANGDLVAAHEELAVAADVLAARLAGKEGTE